MYGLLNLIFVTVEFLLFVNHSRASSSLSGGMCHVTLLPLITFFAMYLSLCTSLNETVCSCAVILVDCTGIASTGVGLHGCMPLQISHHDYVSLFFDLGRITCNPLFSAHILAGCTFLISNRIFLSRLLECVYMHHTQKL